MKRLLLLLFLLVMAAPLYGAVTFSIVNGDGTPNVGNACVLNGASVSTWGNGINCTVNVLGSGTVTVAGSSDFNPSVRWCQLTAGAADCVAVSGTVSGSATLRIYMNLDSLDEPPGIPGAHCPYSVVAGVGVYSCTYSGVTFNGTSIAVTGKLAASVLTPEVTTVNKLSAAELVSAGCSYTHLSAYPDSCPPTITSYPNGTYNLPVAGQPYTDLRFGTKACILANVPVEAPIMRFTSAGGKYVTLKADDGAAPAGIYDMDTCTRVYNYPTGYFGCQYLPNLQKLQAYGLPELTMVCYGAGASLYRLRGVSPPDLTEDGIMWTAPNGEQAINDGGSSTIATDGRKLFYGCTLSTNCGQPQLVTNWPHVYIVDTYAKPTCVGSGCFQTIVDMNWTDARVAAAFAPLVISARAVLMTDKGPDGRYIIKAAQDDGLPQITQFFWADERGNWGTNGLENEATGDKHYGAIGDCTTYNIYCSGPLHETPISVGFNSMPMLNRAVFNATTQASEFDSPSISSSSGKTYPVQFGGGGYFTNVHSEHLTASSRRNLAIYVGSSEPQGTENPQMPILSISSTNPAVITLDQTTCNQTCPLTSLGVTTSDQVYINCDYGNSGTQDMTGYWPVGAVSAGPPYTITLTGLNWTGTYIGSGKCSATKKQAPLNSQDLYAIAVVRMMNLGVGAVPLQIFPIGKQYSTHMYGTGNCIEYFCSQTKPQMSQDGRYVTATTNNGQPNWIRTIRYEVPWQALATKSQELAPGFLVDFKPVVPFSSGGMSIAANVPTSENITCSISVSANIPVGSPTVTLAGPDYHRTGSFTGVAGTTYFWKCVAPSHTEFVAAGVFAPR